MLYRNCRELPMHNFNEIQETNDLSYLIKDRTKHSEAELERHWIDILDESIKLSNDSSQKKFFRDRAELMYLEMKLRILTAIDRIIGTDLTEKQDLEIKKILKGYFVTDTKQGILEVNDKINLKISQFKRVYNIEKSSNFDNVLATMRMNGIHVNRHEMTVAEYYALIDEMKRQSVAQKNASRRKRGIR